MRWTLAMGFRGMASIFAFRGDGIGLIPTLRVVFEAELDGQFLVNFQSRKKVEGTQLANILKGSTFQS